MTVPAPASPEDSAVACESDESERKSSTGNGGLTDRQREDVFYNNVAKFMGLK